MNKRIVCTIRDYWDAYKWVQAHHGRFGIKIVHHINYVIEFREE